MYAVSQRGVAVNVDLELSTHPNIGPLVLSEWCRVRGVSIHWIGPGTGLLDSPKLSFQCMEQAKYAYSAYYSQVASLACCSAVSRGQRSHTYCDLLRKKLTHPTKLICLLEANIVMKVAF